MTDAIPGHSYYDDYQGLLSGRPKFVVVVDLDLMDIVWCRHSINCHSTAVYFGLRKIRMLIGRPMGRAA